jgi:hypothetical protein
VLGDKESEIYAKEINVYLKSVGYQTDFLLAIYDNHPYRRIIVDKIDSIKTDRINVFSNKQKD